jgi:FAD/FMN-containing dehydrogenase/Fe-S oxidoreductase
VDDLITTIQISSETRTPITARGGGTSLSGQSIGPGIILDCSKYLNRILDIDPVGRLVRVQPGVILDHLNGALAPFDLQFGPDVATANRANLGGMIGNNSAGARSIIYGKTIDHVQRLKVVLSDGSLTEFGPSDQADWQRRNAAKTLEGRIYSQVGQIVRQNAEEIRRRFPPILRRVSGYNLDALCSPEAHRWPSVGLVPLIVGSEGTLAVITEAELDLVPRPKARSLFVLHFESLAAAMEALAPCLEFHPSAVELMDQMLLELARNNLALKDTLALVKGNPSALLMVEISGDDAGEVTDRVGRLQKRLDGVPGLTAIIPALEPFVRDSLWNLRKAAVPLLLGMLGDRKPVTFVEDTAVHPSRLPEFVARFREVLRRHGTDGAFYGHASVGCLHIRPVLNLKDRSDVARMRRITEDVTDLLLEFGGSLSGEHGDGLARSEWNRKMFGEQVYQAFRQLKQAFDPHNLFNPGKVVDAPAMTDNLRYDPGYQPAEPSTFFDYRRQEGFVRSIELCNGSGVCRKLKGGTMCPSFRATRDEKDSTRGRANALRLALGGSKIEDREPMTEDRKTERTAPSSILNPRSSIPFRSKSVYDVLDLCLMCKACKSECPSNVDMAKLKAEFLQFYYAGRSRPWGQALMARIHQLNPMGARAAPLVNWLQKRRVSRWLLEKFAGIDRRRSLPRLYWNHFRRWFARHRPAPSAGRYGRVLLLDDCFTTFHEPAIGKAAVRVLEKAGYAIELAGLACCCRPMISKGFLREGRDLIQTQLPDLSRRIAEGVPILGLEPSCLLTLADEWPELVSHPDIHRIAAAAELADSWLARQAKEGRCDVCFKARPEKCILHGHCHQKALMGMAGSVAALRLVPGLDVVALDTGCCGMAGSFGFEKEHYDLSVAIAGLELLPALAADPQALVVAPGTSCRHQIKDLTARRAWHPMEVLAEQINSDG